MASEKITALIEEVKGLTVLELSELVHALEEEFGVSAAAMAAPAAGGGSGHGSGGNAELLLQGVNELGELQNGQALNLFDEGSNLLRSHNM